MAGHVYFIRPVGMAGPVKIGHSICPESRLLTLAVWSPVPLEIAATTPGDVTLERKFHNLLADHWSHYEWFRDAPEVSAVVADVAAGSFDFTRLDAMPATQVHRKKRNYPAISRRRQGIKSRLNWATYAIGLRAPDSIRTAERDLDRVSGEEFEAAVAIIEAFVADPIANGAERSTYGDAPQRFAAYQARLARQSRKAA